MTTSGFGTSAGRRRNSTSASSAVPQILARSADDDPSSPSDSTSCPTIARTPPAHSTRHRFQRAAVLVVDGIGEDVDRLARPRHRQTVWSRSKKSRIRTRSGCSGSGWPFISASRNLTRAKSWAWPRMETIGGSLRSLIVCSRFWIRRRRISRQNRAAVSASSPVTGTAAQRRRARTRVAVWPQAYARGAARARVGSPTSRPACNSQTEEAVLALARRLARATGERDLVFAGGVALNCVSNARLEREGPFRSLFIIGAAHDAGTAIGAALDVAYREGRVRSERPGQPALLCTHPFWAPRLKTSRSRPRSREAGFPSEMVADPAASGGRTCWRRDRLWAGFRDAWSLARRALGHRSLLADPRRAGDPRTAQSPHQAPRAVPAVWRIGAGRRRGRLVHVPWRSRRGRVLPKLHDPGIPVSDSERASLIPAVLHHDGTCRVQVVDATQNPLFHSLISRFRDLTGVPLVLNTSFNDQEPLVATPDDALKTFARSPYRFSLSGRPPCPATEMTD